MDARNGYRAQLELAVVCYQARSGGKRRSAARCRRESDSHVRGARRRPRSGPILAALRLGSWRLPRPGGGGEEAAERALIHYRRSDDSRRGRASARSQQRCITARRPCVRAVNRCEELLLEEGAGPIGRANVGRYLGGLLAMTGAVDRGTRTCHGCSSSIRRSRTDGRGAVLRRAFWPTSPSWRATCRQRARRSRPSAPIARRAGTSDSSRLPQSSLAEAHYLDGDYEAAGHWVAIAREHVATNDLLAQIAWRSVWAKLLARGGRPVQMKCRRRL